MNNKGRWVVMLPLALAVGLGAAVGQVASRFGVWQVGRMVLVLGMPVALLIGVYRLGREPRAWRLVVGLAALALLVGLAAVGMWRILDW